MMLNGTLFSIRQERSRPISVSWSIKCYHVFHIRPHPEIKMIMEREYVNRYDANAIQVSPLQDIAAIYHDAITRPATQQTVRHIAGKQAGRVPANLCRAFRLLLEDNMLDGNITAVYGGDVGPSMNPPPPPPLHNRDTCQNDIRIDQEVVMNCHVYTT